MSSVRSRAADGLGIIRALAAAAAGNVAGHWPLAGASLVAAFGVWFVIQDVDANPRVEQIVPIDTTQLVRVQVDNVPDGYIAVAPKPIQVRVDARKQELAQLRPTDFDARANAEGLPTDVATKVSVSVSTKHAGVRVIGAEPAQVELTVVKAETKEFPVEISRIGRLPEGYVETDAPIVDPAFVKVTGRPDQVANVRSVTVDMNMSGLRDASVTLPGDLVARTESGNPVAITLSQTSARVTFHLEQTFSQRTVPIIPVITGSPAPGYYVSAITVTPPVAVVTGLKAFVDGLKQMSTEKLDITNATRTLTMTRQLDRPPNVSVDRQSVTVTVELRPVDCASGGASTPCGGATLIVAPVFDPVPAGFAVDSAPSSVQVHVSGSILQLATLKPADVRVTVPMTTARLGSVTIVPVALVPTGIRVDSVDPITVTFRALP